MLFSVICVVDGFISNAQSLVPLNFTLCSSTEPYFCQNCYSELFFFQTLDDKQLLNEMRNDDKLNFDINHTNNSFFPAKCLQADNKIKSLLNNLNSGLVDSKYCSQAEANIINKKCKFSLLCENIRSLNANFDELNELLTNYDILPDIIAISETKLKLLQVYIQCKVKWVPFLPQRHNYKMGRSRIVY